MQKKLQALLLVIAMLLTVCVGYAEGAYKAGTYDVKVDGFGGEMTVSVTFTADKLESVVVGDNSETPGIGTPAIEQLPGAIVDNQSLAVDSLTGATVTSDAIKKAVEEAIAEAGGDVEAWKTAAVDKGPKEAVEETADIIVIGGGGAGLSAAVSAAENGATVILIEKTAALGGNTVRAGGPFNAADPARQANFPAASEAAMATVYALAEEEAKSPEHQAVMDQLKADLEAYEAGEKNYLFDSIALHTLQTYAGGDYLGYFDLIQKMTGEALETTEWMAGNGVVWKDDISTVPGGLWPRTHVPQGSAGGDYIKAGQEKSESLGVKIILNCKGEELIVENDRVVGVKAEMTDGTPVTLNANKAVVIATGGFAANKEMRKQYDPSLNENLGTTNTPAATGDGIFMAQKVGANLVGMEYIQCLPLGDPETGALSGWMGAIGVEYYYQVNKEGLRFMAEDGRRDTMTQALLKQTDSMSYVITDTNSEGADNGLNLWGDDIEDLVAKGRIFRADTIEELAEKVGLDPAVLKATHDQFNAYVAAGEDADFGRSLFGAPIDNAPFYASPRMPTVHHTMGGIEIDLKGHVLDADGNVIPGLYAAGEVTGGIHGANRLGGNALLDIHVFGREAGKNAAAE